MMVSNISNTQLSCETISGTYHYLFQPTNHKPYIPQQPKSIIRAMNYAAIFELWHHCLGHPGTKITLKFVEHTIGVPLLKPNKFYNCAACMSCKFRNRHIARLPTTTPSICTLNATKNVHDNNTHITNDVSIGQHLHMEYGFVRGSD